MPICSEPAREISINITARNTGTERWKGSDVVLMGIRELDQGMVRHPIPDGTTVAPGQTYTFSWKVTSPARQGFFISKWQMQHRGVAFGAPIIRDTQIPARDDNAQLISDDIPKELRPGQVVTVHLTFRNVGITIWKGAGCGTDPTDLLMLDSTFGTAAPRVKAGTTVTPGNTYTFDVEIKAPSTPGRYRLRLRPIHQGVRWFGPVISRSIVVR
jgi:hypothetical protein